MITRKPGARVSTGARSGSKVAAACTSALTVRGIIYHRDQAAAKGGSRWGRAEVGTRVTARQT